jgi:hypothetical protein
VFSFEKDFLSVRHGRLSASTQAFLKNSFYLGLLKFAVEDQQCRLPRFFILDNIEDKEWFLTVSGSFMIFSLNTPARWLFRIK